jgi:hypothetical protein
MKKNQNMRVRLSENGFGLAFLQSLLSVVTGTAEPKHLRKKEVCNKYDLMKKLVSLR